MNLDELIDEISKTKKYSSLYHPLINRVCSEEFFKYKKDKDKTKAVKNRLHIIYGAFFYKNIKNIILNTNGNDETEILKLHASANERLPSINEFYKFIFDTINNDMFNINTKKITSKITSITSVLDIGCGFNPFFLPYIRPRLPELKYYYALDIDLELAGMLNKYFKISGLPALAGCTDVISENPKQQADIAFLFKLIPTIENCKKGRGFELIFNIDAKYIIVTFPVKSLCGKNKGMAENYAVSFKKNMKDINNMNGGKIAILAEDIIGSELVYVLSKE